MKVKDVCIRLACSTNICSSFISTPSREGASEEYQEAILLRLKKNTKINLHDHRKNELREVKADKILHGRHAIRTLPDRVLATIHKLGGVGARGGGGGGGGGHSKLRIVY